MNVEFVTRLRVTKKNGNRNGDDLWELLDPFVVRVDGNPWVIPAGFETDFASVPRLPVVYTIAGNVAHKSALVHDYLYRLKGVSRKYADDVFFEAMKTEGVSSLRRNLMYSAVRVFGGPAYKKAQANA